MGVMAMAEIAMSAAPDRTACNCASMLPRPRSVTTTSAPRRRASSVHRSTLNPDSWSPCASTNGGNCPVAMRSVAGCAAAGAPPSRARQAIASRKRPVSICAQFTGSVRAGTCGVTPVSASEKKIISAVKTRFEA